MPYEVAIEGNTLIIKYSDNGFITSISGIRKSINKKTEMLVLDEFRIGSINGQQIDIKSVSDTELEELLNAQESAHTLEIQKSIESAHNNNEIENWSISEINQAGKHILLTTESILTDHVIEKRIEIVTSEVVYGLNMFKDFFANIRDTFGGRSNSMQKALRDARKTCLNELRREALLVGANAVIAISLDYSSISGKDLNMLMLSASGTAVKIAKPSDSSLN